MTSLNLRPVPSSSSAGSGSSAKPHPTKSLLSPWDFSYALSPDGADKNLLILLHGLGDSKTPFFQLGKQLNLPSTAVLALSAPDPLPLMDHPSFSWYPTFTSTYDPLPPSAQNPTKHIPKLRTLLSTLVSKEVGWHLEDIHLFGFGQGGTMALELALDIGKNPISVPSSTSIEALSSTSSSKSNTGPDAQSTAASKPAPTQAKRLGSAVSICSTLLTHPTSNLNLATPICLFTRLSPKSSIFDKFVTPTRRAFREVEIVPPSSASASSSRMSQGGPGADESMPRGKEEWFGIMKFWSNVLKRKEEGWKGQGEVYEVVR